MAMVKRYCNLIIERIRIYDRILLLDILKVRWNWRKSIQKFLTDIRQKYLGFPDIRRLENFCHWGHL